jgi:hypothetical protein
MPTREKIAHMLRLAASVATGAGCNNEQWKDLIDMAAQVEAMRCESCRHQSPVNANLLWCVRWQYPFPPSHGCFKHEQKPAD